MIKRINESGRTLEDKLDVTETLNFVYAYLSNNPRRLSEPRGIEQPGICFNPEYLVQVRLRLPDEHSESHCGKEERGRTPGRRDILNAWPRGGSHGLATVFVCWVAVGFSWVLMVLDVVKFSKVYKLMSA
ncbi:MAG: hypothetical protein QXT86_13525 [Archaeoglobaceae archaeon]